jgi:glycosyltransferase involved in cell wall biosynthesis
MAVVRSVYEQRDLENTTWELIIVDDASTDKTAEAVGTWIREGHSATSYHYEPLIGQAFAMNRGVLAARGKVIIFTDDDVVLDPRWMAEHFDCFQIYGCTGVGGRLLPRFDPEPPDWYRSEFPFPYKFDFGAEPRVISSPPFGANMAYRKAAFEELGLFRTDLGSTPDNPAGKGVDSEFGLRVISAGQTIMYAPKAVLLHPLDSALITKNFMHRWYHQYGMSEILRAPDTFIGPSYFGIPRHLFRTLVTSYFKRIFSVDPRVRYLSEMEIHRVFGVIAGLKKRADLNRVGA